MSAAEPFTRFVAVDWTGAVGERHAGIAVAACGASGVPALVRPGHRWSRGEIGEWVAASGRAGERLLIGFDFSFGLPFADAGAFFPGDGDSPADARTLWTEVAAAAADDAFGAAHGAIARRRRHYWCGAADGPKAVRARLRLVEQVCTARGLGPASSVFALIGAAQCGKASLAGMRLLERAGVPVWPFDPLPASGPLIVEIYCRVFAAAGGVRGKIRDRATLLGALNRLDGDGANPAYTDADLALPDRFADHIGDAMVSAAGMRRAAADPATWTPAGMAAVRTTEGWTFGVT